jgi:hypothetical protein
MSAARTADATRARTRVFIQVEISNTALRRPAPRRASKLPRATRAAAGAPPAACRSAWAAPGGVLRPGRVGIARVSPRPRQLELRGRRPLPRTGCASGRRAAGHWSAKLHRSCAAQLQLELPLLPAPLRMVHELYCAIQLCTRVFPQVQKLVEVSIHLDSSCASLAMQLRVRTTESSLQRALGTSRMASHASESRRFAGAARRAARRLARGAWPLAAGSRAGAGPRVRCGSLRAERGSLQHAAERTSRGNGAADNNAENEFIRLVRARAQCQRFDAIWGGELRARSSRKISAVRRGANQRWSRARGATAKCLARSVAEGELHRGPIIAQRPACYADR